MVILSIVSLIWGMLAIFGMAVGIIPFLGSLNYLNIPFAVFGLLFQRLGYRLIIEKRTRCCWVFPVWRSHFHRGDPTRLRFRDFLIRFLKAPESSLKPIDLFPRFML